MIWRWNGVYVPESNSLQVHDLFTLLRDLLLPYLSLDLHLLQFAIETISIGWAPAAEIPNLELQGMSRTRE
jgi:hypothetical protein